MQTIDCVYCDYRVKGSANKGLTEGYCIDPLKATACEEFIKLSDTGLCAGKYNTKYNDIFFDDVVRWEEAVKVCLNCDIIKLCRIYATNTQSFGIWGGLKPQELIKRRRKLERKAKEGVAHTVSDDNDTTINSDHIACGI